MDPTFIAPEEACRHAVILTDLYNSEINCCITSFWDGGFDVSLGDEMNGWRAHKNVRKWTEVAPWLREAAIEHYPTSVFAEKWRSL